MADQVAGEHNLGALLSSGRGEGPPIGMGVGVRLIASVVSLPPWWGRPGYAETVPVVPLVDGGIDTSSLTRPAVALFGLAVTFVLLVVVGGRAFGRGDHRTIVLVAVAVTSLLACLVSMQLSPLNVLGLTPHQMRWLWPVSALTSATLLIGVAAELRRDRVVERTFAAATVVVVVWTLPTYVAGAGPTAEREYTDSIISLVEQLESYRPDQPVVLDDTGTRFIEPYSGPVFATLGRSGVDVRSSRPGLVRQIGSGRRADGTERIALSIREGDLAHTIPPGSRRIAFVDPLDAGEQAEIASLRAAILERVAATGLELNDAGLAAVERGEIGFAPLVVPAGGDAGELEAAGWIGILAANDWLVLDDSERAMFARYGELSTRRDLYSVAVFETPVP